MINNELRLTMYFIQSASRLNPAYTILGFFPNASTSAHEVSVFLTRKTQFCVRLAFRNISSYQSYTMMRSALGAMLHCKLHITSVSHFITVYP